MSNEKVSFKAISSKYTHYVPDGLGRDAYINNNNGGFIKSVQIKVKREGFSIPQNCHLYNIKKDASTIKYRSDGSGRDSYVMYFNI